ncbi:MAG: 2TM domain-containing protein [Dehalococcoidia bacterium]|nr:MAG: 2TM domain-containing protein [Dehalococcoidia bacterium]
MAQELSEEEIYTEARKRVKAKRDFYRHLGAYLVVNTVLVIIWALSGDAARQTYGPGDWTGGK